MIKGFSAILLLIGALTISIGAAIAMGTRNEANRAGPLLWQEDSRSVWPLAPGLGELRIVPHNLPPPPFTLEITARFSGRSAPTAYWLVRTRYVSVRISGQGFFYLVSIPRGYSSRLRSVGEFNQLSLDVDTDSNVTLRFNGAVGWQGHIDPGAMALQSDEWTIEAQCNCSSNEAAALTWERIALYAPGR